MPPPSRADAFALLADLLGQRLRFLRSYAIPDGYSRAYVARQTGLSVATIARIERTGRSSAVALTQLLAFYQLAGLSVAWAITPDNAGLFPDTFSNRWPSPSEELAQELADLRQLTQEPELRARLTGALVQVLPRVHDPLRGPLDLPRYQRYLPPVAATTTGWHARAFNLPPFHYYQAGDSQPRCGDVFAYLTHESPPERGSTSARCLRCTEQLGTPS